MCKTEDTGLETNCLAECQSLIDQIAQSATRSRLGCTNWLALQDVSQSEKISFGPLNDTFYKGRVGIGLLLTLASRQFQNSADSYQALAFDSAKEIVQNLLDERRCLTHAKVSNAGLCGSGGIVYGLLGIGSLLGKSEAIDAAITLLHAQASHDTQIGHAHDLFDGTSGLLFAASRLFRETNDSRILNAIRSLAESLLAVSPSDIEFCGFAHGAMGIATALFEAYTYTSNERYLISAKGLLEHDIERFDRDVLQCDQLSEPFKYSLRRGWSGVLVANALCNNYLEISTGYAFASSAEIAFSVSNLCCGVSGIWMTDSMTNACRGSDSCARLPSLCINASTPFADPSLFRGLAGNAWAILSQYGTESLPHLFEIGL